MELTKSLWTESDRIPFLDYLKSLKNNEKEDWARKMLNTRLPLLVLPTPRVNEMVKAIQKGDYFSFLELNIDDYYETIAIQGKLISMISDFEIQSKYLSTYIYKMENWAHVDIMSFTNIEMYKQKFIHLSDEYILSDKPFIRRLSLMILFQLVKDPKILPTFFKRLNQLKDETEYYVIMMAGWLLSECIIKYKDETLAWLKQNDLNEKVQNKGIQKCRESRRLSQIEKDELLAYKK
ncbi:DNA alkylation repair protein [Acholeplasma vituli]|uniref:DNA alkylation repair protein n=1 Tax=Paracholeplasma vituli TaxID=69473 RepID=A0ABT2PVG4_9MOLU|nr:DNA alkylation repair protein [Paracholeplasma vituli]MCU0104401.1 DNA alkylation repair protein [Paracholeplasma vituli]